MQWFARAGRLAGKATLVGLILWFSKGVQRSQTVKFSYKMARLFGVNRHAVYRALKALEGAGLVSIKRHQGRSPLVTIQNDSLLWDHDLDSD